LLIGLGIVYLTLGLIVLIVDVLTEVLYLLSTLTAQVSGIGPSDPVAQSIAALSEAPLYLSSTIVGGLLIYFGARLKRNAI
jgi:hypothetical protein